MATIYLARFLAKAGANVTVAAILKSSEGTFSGVRYVDLGAQYSCEGAIARASKSGPYVVISAGRALPLLASFGDPHCVARLLITHDGTGNHSGLSMHALMHLADHVLCVSSAQRQLLLREGADPLTTHVVSNGVDLELYAPADPATRDQHKMVFAGALVQDKGIGLLLEAFKRLKPKHHQLSLDVYGSAALWGRENFFDPAALQQQLPGVLFHGAVAPQTLAHAYRGAGLLVYPAIWPEAFGMTAADAIATGCPVVAFDVGGPRDIVKDNETGVLMPEVSVEALTATLDRLLSHPTLLRELSQKILARHRERFDWSRSAQEVLTLCERASATRRTDRSALRPHGQAEASMIPL